MKFLLGMVLMGSAYADSISPITDEIFQQMTYSWKDVNPVPLSDLRYVTVTYLGYDDQPHQGSFIIHAIVADEIVEIFQEIYEAGFPIEKMQLVDVYQGIDELSAQDNNSYSFCCRPNTTFPHIFSKHSYGLAIDINPLYNPYQRGDLIVPATGAPYLDRTLNVKGMIQPDSPIVLAFKKRGWDWAGEWMETRGRVDYQHFEKEPFPL